MDQNTVQNSQEGFWRKYGSYLIAGAIIAILVGVYFATKKSATETNNTQNQESGAQTATNITVTENQNENQNQQGERENTGNVSAVGTLMASDNLAKGNLMVNSEQGKIYIATARDFSAQVGKEVTLNAEGTLNSFVFLGFNQDPGTVAGAVTPPEVANIHVEGTLQNSDNLDKGNYVIATDSGKVYLQSQKDYSAWVGRQVQLSAQGTIQSFTQAVLAQK